MGGETGCIGTRTMEREDSEQILDIRVPKLFHFYNKYIRLTVLYARIIIFLCMSHDLHIASTVLSSRFVRKLSGCIMVNIVNSFAFIGVVRVVGVLGYWLRFHP